MQKIWLSIFLFAAIFAGAYTAARMRVKEKEPLLALSGESRFKPAPFALQNRPFAIAIIGLNNGAYVEKTLASVFSQVYENYRVIYIDDGSKDGSFDLARDLIYDGGHLGQVTLVQNEESIGVLANVVRAVQSCKDDEIMVIVGGEDLLAHEWVLQRLNLYYADPDLWLTYGQYRDFPAYTLGSCHPCEEEKLRLQPFAAAHLKTFYAALFKKVRESDFVLSGKFLPSCAEMAYMIPMLELAKGHSHFIEETLYVRNGLCANREDREAQIRCEKFVRALDPYPPLTALQVQPCGE